MTDQQHKQADILIERINTEADREIASILSDAQEQAGATIRQAHQKARAQVHRVVADIRQSERRKTTLVIARIDTTRRQLGQAQNLQAIRTGLPLLHDALVTQWNTAAQRKKWIGSILEQAFFRLTSGTWRVEHPSPLTKDDTKAIVNGITAHTGKTPELVADDTLSGGIRVWADAACLDGSITAILADEQEISAMLLGELNKAEGGRS